jgi:RNA polymerase sigma-54 factor
MIKPGLQLGLGQHLTMTPQLRQALKLLQLSSLELRETLNEALANNVMLESMDTASEDWDGADTAPADAEPAAETDYDATDYGAGDWPEHATDGADPDAWRDRVAGSEESLRDYLMWQLRLARLSETDFMIGSTLIDSIDDNGYLRASTPDIVRGLAPDVIVGEDEVEAVLHRIQTFDPIGVGARSLGESLTLQLGLFAPDTPGRRAALAIAGAHLEDLAAGRRRQIQRQLELDDAEMAAAEALIQSLDPHPGAAIGGVAANYLVPDVLVVRRGRRWTCEINPTSAPRLRVNPLYERCLKGHRGDSSQAPLRQQLDEARWLLRSLNMRSATLLRVANAIVEHQQEFFDRGEEAMKPLGLKSIAERVDMHESTISRVCANKSMLTPRGVYEFRYFFSNAVSSDGGPEDHSALAIRAMIRKLIAAESAARPLSDSRISAVLKSQGIDVARRTVAKYREALDIPPSHQRKQTRLDS